MAWYLPCGVVTLYIVKAILDKLVLSKTDGVCDELVCMKCAKFAYGVYTCVYYAQN